ncbi:type II toxin-antitoxin system VapC family toxin [Halorussus ruber]|uniref:type II toxin-antitoxin system VapC family toxin n=1 Tax=Halorussus ruber TaxID=1126238 RepID=UPI0010918A62|nr:PIN domain-containing protein [Halorussus ruber]
MATAVLDSNVLIASRDGDDERCELSRTIIQKIDHGELPEVRVVSYVVVETLNLLHSRHSHRLALDTYDRLNQSAGFRIEHITESDFKKGTELFHRYSGLSFVDAVLVAYMRREGITYLYSFDSDFDALDSVTRLQTDANPFGP